jgi:hypothetical protein
MIGELMKRLFFPALILLILLGGYDHSKAIEKQESNSNDQIQFSNNQFKCAYEAWYKAIQKPEILISSKNESYQDIPEFQALIKIGEPALDDLERIMKQKTGMSHMLYLAVIKIKKWNFTDFAKPGISNQEITEQVIERLEKEKQR